MESEHVRGIFSPDTFKASGQLAWRLLAAALLSACGPVSNNESVPAPSGWLRTPTTTTEGTRAIVRTDEARPEPEFIEVPIEYPEPSPVQLAPPQSTSTPNLETSDAMVATPSSSQEIAVTPAPTPTAALAQPPTRIPR